MLRTPPHFPVQSHLILIGIMGCGKTTIGKELHRTMNLPFLDTDVAIEQEQQTSIPHIFATYGEDQFRDMETNLLQQHLVSSTSPMIVSTGGGIIIRPENRRLLHAIGFVVWLYATPDILFQRIARCTNRPLLQTPNPLQKLRDLVEERSPWYRETAHMAIDTSDLTIHEIVSGIMDSYRVAMNQRAYHK